MLRRFVELLPRGARVLDYGCGIGRELAWMRQQGLVVEGLDGTPEFVHAARRQCPGIASRDLKRCGWLAGVTMASGATPR
jgi:SAM-dependent methyltransferase